MKELTSKSHLDLLKGEYYLVKVNYDWSPSSHDIAEWDGKEFYSQTSNTVIPVTGIEEYQLLEQ